MTLQTCVLRALTRRRRVSIAELRHAGRCCFASSAWQSVPPPALRCGDAAEEPSEDGDDCDWNEFDPTPLESWILDDFDWDIEQAYPDAATIGMTRWTANGTGPSVRQ